MKTLLLLLALVGSDGIDEWAGPKNLPEPGQRWELRDALGLGQAVDVAASYEVWLVWDKASYAGDIDTVDRLKARGLVVEVASGTPVLVIHADNQSSTVRMLSGRYQGQKGVAETGSLARKVQR